MRTISLLSLGMLTLPAHAALAPHDGFSGTFSLLTGYTSTSSNLNADGEKTLHSLNHKADSDDKAFLAPLGNLAYTFGEQNQQQVYAGTMRDDLAIGTLAFQIGYKYQLADGTIIDASIAPNLLSHDVWRNPYTVNQKRHKTDADVIAYRLKLDNIAGSPFSLDLAYAQLDIDHDDVTDRDLRREGDAYRVKAQYRYAISNTVYLQPAASYLHFDAKGKASQYDQYGVDATLIQVFERQQLALTAGYATRDFERGSTTFNGRTRDDNEFRLFAAYEYEQPFDWQDWSLIALGGYKKTDSNIRFYDSSEYLVSLGAKYEF